MWISFLSVPTIVWAYFSNGRDIAGFTGYLKSFFFTAILSFNVRFYYLKANIKREIRAFGRQCYRKKSVRWGDIVYDVISVFLQCMNNIWGHHVFNNESKYSMGHSERYLREDGPFRGALPIPVSRKTVPALTMVVAFNVMGFPWAPNSGFVSKYVYFIQILFWMAGRRWYF